MFWTRVFVVDADVANGDGELTSFPYLGTVEMKLGNKDQICSTPRISGRGQKRAHNGGSWSFGSRVFIFPRKTLHIYPI